MKSRLLSAYFIIMALVTVAALVYVLGFAPPAERFTEFYLLNTEGNASIYPDRIDAGEELRVIAGIVNREQETVTYRIETLVDGIPRVTTGPVTLQYEETYENEIAVTMLQPGEHIKVEFLLYRQDNPDVYRSLYLWVDVVE